MNILVATLNRDASKGIPRRSLKLLYDYFLIDYSIQTVLNLQDNTNIFSEDDILNISMTLGVKIYKKDMAMIDNKILQGNDHCYIMDKKDLKIKVLADEAPTKQNVRRSFLSKKFILKGKIIENTDLTFIRIGSGISLKFIDKVFSEKANVDINDDVPQWNLLS